MIENYNDMIISLWSDYYKIGLQLWQLGTDKRPTVKNDHNLCVYNINDYAYHFAQDCIRDLHKRFTITEY